MAGLNLKLIGVDDPFFVYFVSGPVTSVEKRGHLHIVKTATEEFKADVGPKINKIRDLLLKSGFKDISTEVANRWILLATPQELAGISNAKMPRKVKGMVENYCLRMNPKNGRVLLYGDIPKNLQKEGEDSSVTAMRLGVVTSNAVVTTTDDMYILSGPANSGGGKDAAMILSVTGFSEDVTNQIMRVMRRDFEPPPATPETSSDASDPQGPQPGGQ